MNPKYNPNGQGRKREFVLWKKEIVWFLKINKLVEDRGRGLMISNSLGVQRRQLKFINLRDILGCWKIKLVKGMIMIGSELTEDSQYYEMIKRVE